MIVIDNKKKIKVKLQGKSSCQRNKICGHSFLRALKKGVNVERLFACQKTVDLCTWHYDKKKKKMPNTFSTLKSFIFLIVRENPFNALQKAN